MTLAQKHKEETKRWLALAHAAGGHLQVKGAVVSCGEGSPGDYLRRCSPLRVPSTVPCWRCWASCLHPALWGHSLPSGVDATGARCVLHQAHALPTRGAALPGPQKRLLRQRNTSTGWHQAASLHARRALQGPRVACASPAHQMPFREACPYRAACVAAPGICRRCDWSPMMPPALVQIHAIMNYAFVLKSEGKRVSARRTYEQALGIAREAFGPLHPTVEKVKYELVAHMVKCNEEVRNVTVQ
jgi:hypothetical protein